MLKLIVVALLVIGFAVEILFGLLNMVNRKKPLPDSIKRFFKESYLRKSFLYASVNLRFGLISSLFSLVITLLMILGGGFEFVTVWVQSISDSLLLQSYIFFGSLLLASDIVSLPFTLIDTFGIEQRFGFNKTSVGTFILDKIKSWFVGGIIGGILLGLLVFFYQWLGSSFWIWFWMVAVAFSLFMVMFYTTVFVPLFNKLTPLTDGELKDSIVSFCKKADFKINNIYVLDGSKRSTKGNAFFSGLGKTKKIVLYDNLIDQLTVDEIVAVLAHEIGHYKHNHIPKGIVISTLQIGLTLYLLSLFLSLPNLSSAIGVSSHSIYTGLIAFGLLFSPISSVLSFFFSIVSRKNEYQADDFVKKFGLEKSLVSALGNLTQKNYSTPNPHPIVVLLTYSHPSLVQRVENLTK